jgi:hypothetical protein
VSGNEGADGAVPEQVRRVGRRYVRASLFYLSLGALTGVALMAWGNDNFKFVHAHLVTAGGGLFMLFALGLLVLPERFGRPDAIHAGWAHAQFILANIGLAGMIAGSMLPVGLGLDRIGTAFGLLLALSVVLYAWVIGAAFRD